jgi:hypothetical protein
VREEASVRADPGVGSVSHEGNAGQVQDSRDASKRKLPECSRGGGAAVIFKSLGRNEMGRAFNLGLVEFDQ